MHGHQFDRRKHQGAHEMQDMREHGPFAHLWRMAMQGRGHHGFGMAWAGGGFPMRDRMDFFDSGDGGADAAAGDGRGWRGGGGPHGRGPHGFGFGFGRGPGRPERPLEQGDLRWLVLNLIAAQPRHGYEIIKAIEDALNGHYAPSPGVIYPTLTYLEETGLIFSEAQATKKLYTLTEEGRKALDENAGAVQAAHARIEDARIRFGGRPAPEMGRAMDNLRAAIQVRLAKGELSAESLAAVTAALDRAASEIERS